MNAKCGQLFGVSVGPGDPGLLTVRADEVLRAVDCIAAPAVGNSRRIALSLVEGYLQGKQLIDCPTPMTRDKTATARAYDEIADMLAGVLESGKSVAFVTLGDASVYSTWTYVNERMKARGYTTETVAGVTSFSAAAAKLGEALCAGSEQLHVVPGSAGDVGAALDAPGTKVFMKSGRHLAELQDELRRRELSSSLVARCGLPGERIVRDFTAMEDPGEYLSVVIVKDQEGAGGSSSSEAGASTQQLLPSSEKEAPEAKRAPNASSSFFQNRACQYFPCHDDVAPEDFNCLLCYCPLYALGDQCGGRFSYTASGVKDCSNCSLPHRGEDGVAMVKRRFADLADIAGKARGGAHD